MALYCRRPTRRTAPPRFAPAHSTDMRQAFAPAGRLRVECPRSVPRRKAAPEGSNSRPTAPQPATRGRSPGPFRSASSEADVATPKRNPRHHGRAQRRTLDPSPGAPVASPSMATLVTCTPTPRRFFAMGGVMPSGRRGHRVVPRVARGAEPLSGRRLPRPRRRCWCAAGAATRACAYTSAWPGLFPRYVYPACRLPENDLAGFCRPDVEGGGGPAGGHPPRSGPTCSPLR